MNHLKHVVPIFYRPRHEWDVIETESASVQSLYVGYIIPLALLTPVALKIRLIRENFLGFDGFSSIFFDLTWIGMVANFAWGLAEIYVLAWLLNVYSFYLYGKSAHARALEVLAFSATPVWVGHAFLAVPMLSFDMNVVIRVFSLLYSGFLHYLGFRTVMHIGVRKACVYVLIVVAAYWGSYITRDAIIPAAMDFYRQWPVLDQRTRELVGIACILFFVSLVLLWAYWRRQNVMPREVSDESEK